MRSAFALALAVAVVGAPATAWARDAVGPRVGLELDPLPFLEQGYSVHLVTKPDREARLRLSVGSFGYGVEGTGDNSGWHTRQDSVELSAGYFPFSRALRGGFVALYGFEQRFSHERDDASGIARRYFVTLAPALGYQWLVFGKGPYITPWAALGVPVVKSGDTTLAGHDYTEPKLEPILAVHLGWELAL